MLYIFKGWIVIILIYVILYSERTILINIIIIMYAIF